MIPAWSLIVQFIISINAKTLLTLFANLDSVQKILMGKSTSQSL